MIKKLTIITTFALSVGCSALASEMYVGAEAGYSMLSKKPNKSDYLKKPDGSSVYGISLGSCINDNVRVDLALNQRTKYVYGHSSSNTLDSQNISSTSLMANAYYDFVNKSGFNPYVMAGIGGAYNKAGDYKLASGAVIVHPKHSKSNVAFQFGGGVSHKMAQNVSLDLGYRYVNLGKIATASNINLSSIKGKINTHEVSVGMKYYF